MTSTEVVEDIERWFADFRVGKKMSKRGVRLIEELEAETVRYAEIMMRLGGARLAETKPTYEVAKMVAGAIAEREATD